ncbi:arsenate reductase/protein-tyrosine-phosphatase family protein [Micromonospora sp. NBC_01796]|uniref:arsenate reductase/protein-tyrosine-phosphatase family protein n=1 Tax=Micromonospora sp. NBC_01796 TaxID=2975987 RepID=UPI002DD8DD39|nr:low molecular weight phosphatase family protein [Micromonospora sp. NBC_01796]WSA84699.1 low molecular weight phosphatase family protein [Micromonospora sp. NBC_01796]
MLGGVLIVCHANLCRSPMAEYLARELLAQRLGGEAAGVPVGSAGTHAVPGYPMHPHAARVTAERGTDPEAFRSRPLHAEQLRGAGLILTATRAQRTTCVSLAPSALRRTFTLRQFARLAAAAVQQGGTGEQGATTPDGPRDPVRRLDAAVAAASRARAGLQPPARPDDDDLTDPVGLPIAEFRHCVREIERALRPTVGLIAVSG